MKKMSARAAYPRAAYGHRLCVGVDYSTRLNSVADGIAWLSDDDGLTSAGIRALIKGRIQTYYNRFVSSPAARGSGLTSIDIPTGLADNRLGTGEIHLVLTVRKLKFPKFGCSHEFVELRTAGRAGGDWKEVA